MIGNLSAVRLSQSICYKSAIWVNSINSTCVYIRVNVLMLSMAAFNEEILPIIDKAI